MMPPDKILANGRTITQKEILAAIITLLQYCDENPLRDGLLETPQRVVKAFKELTSGYHTDPVALLKTFENDSECHDMVTVRDIPFYSLCEHHMLPFFGLAHISYVPGDRIVGLSKFARLVDAFARRFQVQERLTQQIANAIDEAVSPMGVMVVVEAEHFCMAMRGVQKAGSKTSTSAVRGIYAEKPEARAECVSLLLKGNGR